MHDPHSAPLCAALSSFTLHFMHSSSGNQESGGLRRVATGTIKINHNGFNWRIGCDDNNTFYCMVQAMASWGSRNSWTATTWC